MTTRTDVNPSTLMEAMSTARLLPGRAVDPQNEKVVYVAGHHWPTSLAAGRKGHDRPAQKTVYAGTLGGSILKIRR